MKKILQILIFLSYTFVTLYSSAGTQAIREEKFEFKQIATLSKGLERTLAAKSVQVAIVARVGLNPDLLPTGVKYSHVGFAVYSKIETQDGRLLPGYAVYNLYQGAERTGRSHITQDYPVDYLAVSQKLNVGIIIPNRKLQSLILKTIFSDTYQKLHNSNYSVFSNPFSVKYQNCTEFVLDIIFSAIYNTDDPNKIKSNIMAYFKPQPIHVDNLKLQIASMTMPDVKVDDHQGLLATTTFSSIAQFLMENEIAVEVLEYTVEPSTLYGNKKKLDF